MKKSMIIASCGVLSALMLAGCGSVVKQIESKI